MKTSLPRRRPFLFFPILAAALACSAAFATAQTPAAPPQPAPAPAPIVAPPAPAPAPAPAPTPAPAPAPAPAPSEQTPALARRPEEEVTAPAPTPAPAAGTNPPTQKGPSIFERASAYLQNRDGLAAQIAERDNQISALTAQLAERDQTISAQATELAELRAGRDSLTAAIGRLEGESRTVAETVANLGFAPAALPGAQPVEAAGDTEESLLASFRAEQDPKKKSELFGKLTDLRDRAARARYSRN